MKSCPHDLWVKRPSSIGHCEAHPQRIDVGKPATRSSAGLICRRRRASCTFAKWCGEESKNRVPSVNADPLSSLFRSRSGTAFVRQKDRWLTRRMERCYCAKMAGPGDRRTVLHATACRGGSKKSAKRTQGWSKTSTCFPDGTAVITSAKGRRLAKLRAAMK